MGKDSQRRGHKVREYKIVMFGSGGVGKTSLVRQFLHQEYKDIYVPTVEDSYQHIIQSGSGSCYSLEIMDTSGVYAFPAMRQLNIRLSDAFILVFSLDNEESVEMAKTVRQEIVSIKGSTNVPIMLVGNKCDLKDRRKVAPEDAARMARDFGSHYAETSAKLNINVHEIFVEMIAQFITSCEDDPNVTTRLMSRREMRHTLDRKRFSDDPNLHKSTRMESSRRVALWRTKRLSSEDCNDFEEIRMVSSAGCLNKLNLSSTKSMLQMRRQLSDANNNNTHGSSDKCVIL